MTTPKTKQAPIRATTQSFTEIEEIQDDIVLMKDFSAVEQTPMLEGNTMTMMLIPLAEKPAVVEKPPTPQVEKKQD